MQLRFSYHSQCNNFIKSSTVMLLHHPHDRLNSNYKLWKSLIHSALHNHTPVYAFSIATEFISKQRWFSRATQKNCLTLNLQKTTGVTSNISKNIASFCGLILLQLSFRIEGHTQKVNNIIFLINKHIICSVLRVNKV